MMLVLIYLGLVDVGNSNGGDDDDDVVGRFDRGHLRGRLRQRLRQREGSVSFKSFKKINNIFN